MRKRLTLTLTLAALAGGTLLAGSASAADPDGTIEVAGQARSYSVHVPQGPVPPGGFPLVLVFHGGGMSVDRMKQMTGLEAVADARRFIVVYPEGIDRHWNDGRSTIKNPQDDVRFVSDLLDRLQRDYRIDPGRVYATGASNGALFAERVGCELSGRIAGIAAVAGTLPVETIAACHPVKPLAVLQIDGNADPIMPYGGGAVKDFGGRGEGGLVTSVADTAAFWARHNGCGAPGAPEPLPVRAPLDPTRVIRMRYTACMAGTRVTVLTVEGGGHVWPGSSMPAFPRITGAPSRQIDASEAIATFFLTLPRR
ncbi:alpha/beta hydrolase family esterase [Novosphingobium sp. 9]|uniref:alpha/beta hydrolase family esterase n=1 Tax=Novosphingobium sp. 9 TaxID=2025349 RepID=UPI0021B5C92A|nr:PHB depolymerase family esterase [Novosphingobium sp. 9]